MSRGEFYVGKILLTSSVGDQPYYSVFEDDGETGYFYACDERNSEDPLLDALHIYNVCGVKDKDKLSLFEIMWKDTRTGLFINGHCHAIFDFAKMEGQCRTNFPPSKCRKVWKPSAR